MIRYSIKADIDPYLNDINVSDEVLLESLNPATNNEAERKHKLRKNARVNVFEASEVDQPNQPRKSTKENPILNEIKSLRAELNEIKSLKADVAKLKETLGQSAVTKPRNHPRRRIACPNCAKEGGKECSHCYHCGETGHLKMNRNYRIRKTG